MTPRTVAAVYQGYSEIYLLHYFNSSTVHLLFCSCYRFCPLGLYYCNIGPAQQQLQHTDCIYGHHIELLHEKCSNVFMSVLHICLFYKPNNWCWKSDKIHRTTFTSTQYNPPLIVWEFQNRSHKAFCISLYIQKYPIWLCDIQYLCNLWSSHTLQSQQVQTVSTHKNVSHFVSIFCPYISVLTAQWTISCYWKY